MNQFKESRTAKSLRAQEEFEVAFTQALQANQELREAKSFSVPSSDGLLAIHVAGRRRKLSTNGDIRDHDRRVDYAEAIAQQRDRTNQYGGIVLRESTSLGLIEEDLLNRQVSDMLIIAPGAIGTARLRARTNLTWLDIAQKVDHLKQGTFEQHMLGNPKEATPIALPLGACAVSNVSNLKLLIDLDYGDLAVANKEPINPAFFSGIALRDQFEMFDDSLT